MLVFLFVSNVTVDVFVHNAYRSSNYFYIDMLKSAIDAYFISIAGLLSISAFLKVLLLLLTGLAALLIYALLVSASSSLVVLMFFWLSFSFRASITFYAYSFSVS